VGHGWLAKVLGPLVAVAVEHTQEDGDDDTCRGCGDERDLGGEVVRGVLCAEGLGADDVGDGECRSDNGASSNLVPLVSSWSYQRHVPFSYIHDNSHQRSPRSRHTEQRTIMISMIVAKLERQTALMR
jgi:hypothetical protein